MGGTNILDPLGDVLLKSSAHSRCVILLTDGDVEKWGNVKELINNHLGNTRMYIIYVLIINNLID